MSNFPPATFTTEGVIFHSKLIETGRDTYVQLTIVTSLLTGHIMVCINVDGKHVDSFKNGRLMRGKRVYVTGNMLDFTNHYKKDGEIMPIQYSCMNLIHASLSPQENLSVNPRNPNEFILIKEGCEAEIFDVPTVTTQVLDELNQVRLSDSPKMQELKALLDAQTQISDEYKDEIKVLKTKLADSNKKCTVTVPVQQPVPKQHSGIKTALVIGGVGLATLACPPAGAAIVAASVHGPAALAAGTMIGAGVTTAVAAAVTE